MRRLISLVPALLLAAACGDSGTTGAIDMAIPPDLTSGADMTPQPDLKPLQTGTQLAGGPQGLSGVTSDDWAIISMPDGTANAVAAAGMPKEIDPLSDIVAIRGKVVFSWSKYNASAGIGDLTVWTAAAGAHALGTGAQYAIVAASDDGLYVAYTLAASNGAADLWVAKADGTDAKKMWSGVVTGGACRARMTFLPGNKVLASHCTENTNGKATLSTFDVASGAVADLAKDVYAIYFIDQARQKLIIVTLGGEGQVLPAAGGSPVKFDSDIAWVVLTPDGKDVIYGTSAKNMKRSPTTNPSPSTLVPGSVDSILGASSDYKWGLYASKVNSQTGNSDLFLADLTTMKTPVTLSTLTTGTVYGDPFTADSSHALYITAVTAMYIGVLNAIPVAGGMPKVIGQKVWVAYNASGTTIVYNDNYKPLTGQTYGRADLFSTDVAKSDTPRLIATQADADFYLNTAKNKVFYTISQGAAAGLYLAPIP